MNSSYYKYCIVAQCKSTTIKTPNKLFIYVPNNKQIRRKWLKLARRQDALTLSTASTMYFCEDHFDLPNDMENYIQYTTMGEVSRIRMRPGCLPSKFACQRNRTNTTSTVRRPAAAKRQRLALINECEEEIRAAEIQHSVNLNVEVPSQDKVAVGALLDSSDINMRCVLPTCDHNVSQNSSPGSSSHRVPEELGPTDWESSSIECSKHFLVENEINLDHNYSRKPKERQRKAREENLKVCRICFVTDVEMHSMPLLKDLNEAYETITGISTADEEHLPRYLCAGCADRLMNCARFRRRSLRAHLMLLDIVRRHGQVTVELIRSELQIHNPFSSDPADNQNEENIGFDTEDLEEINKLTDARTNTQLKEFDVYVDIKNIKSEEDFAIDHSQVNSEDRTDDIIDMTVNEVKTENDGVSDEEDFNAFTSKSNEDIEVDGINSYDPISQDDRGVCSSDLDEDTKVDIVTIDNNSFINQDIVNDEVISDKSLVYSSRLYEDTIINAPKMEYSDVCNEVISMDEKLPNDYMEHRHAFLFVGEDVLNDPIHIQRVGQKAEKVMERDVNEVIIYKQETPEVDGPP